MLIPLLYLNFYNVTCHLISGSAISCFLATDELVWSTLVGILSSEMIPCINSGYPYKCILFISFYRVIFCLLLWSCMPFSFNVKGKWEEVSGTPLMQPSLLHHIKGLCGLANAKDTIVDYLFYVWCCFW